MRAFLTGGTGFVGGHLAERLREEGWQVRAIARNGSNADVLEDCGCEILRGGLESERSLRRGVEGADAVFHLAGVTKGLSEADFMRVNAEGTRRVVAAARQARFRGRFVALSSLAAAGPARRGRPLTEDKRPRPVSAYGRSKLAGEKHVLRARRFLDFTILRPGAIYGPREHEILEAVKLIERLGVSLEFAETRVQMTHVHDVVSGILAAVNSPQARGRTFFLNDGTVWDYANVVDEIGAALGRDVRHVRVPLAGAWAVAGTLDLAGKIVGRPLSPIGRDKVREVAAGSWIADSSALTAATGWKARHGFVQGIRDTVRWYRENGWL